MSPFNEWRLLTRNNYHLYKKFRCWELPKITLQIPVFIQILPNCFWPKKSRILVQAQNRLKPLAGNKMSNRKSWIGHEKKWFVIWTLIFSWGPDLCVAWRKIPSFQFILLKGRLKAKEDLFVGEHYDWKILVSGQGWNPARYFDRCK